MSEAKQSKQPQESNECLPKAVHDGPLCAAAACGVRQLRTLSICSIFCSVMDLMARILGLHRTSLRLPFSLYTKPAFGNTSLSTLRPFTI